MLNTLVHTDCEPHCVCSFCICAKAFFKVLSAIPTDDDENRQRRAHQQKIQSAARTVQIGTLIPIYVLVARGVLVTKYSSCAQYELNQFTSVDIWRWLFRSFVLVSNNIVCLLIWSLQVVLSNSSDADKTSSKCKTSTMWSCICNDFPCPIIWCSFVCFCCAFSLAFILVFLKRKTAPKPSIWWAIAICAFFRLHCHWSQGDLVFSLI